MPHKSGHELKIKQNKSTIPPNSSPGKVLKERKKNPAPLGSRSYPGPDTRKPWERGGISKAEYDKLPKKYKEMLNQMKKATRRELTL